VLPAAEAVGEEREVQSTSSIFRSALQKSLFDFDAEAEADRCRVR
jgi:hypothetical protein